MKASGTLPYITFCAITANIPNFGDNILPALDRVPYTKN